MNPEKILTDQISAIILGEFKSANKQAISIQRTKKEFPGDFTLVCFPLTKYTEKNPEETANLLGKLLLERIQEIETFNVVKGFLNLELKISFWHNYFNHYSPELNPILSEKVMIEYSSPNTNKPLHLGHVRNNLLGFSLSRILRESGKDTVKVNLINDRGIHICKSMVAWLMNPEKETPDNSGLKGDHLVGKYYVEFDKFLGVESEKIINRIMQGDYSGLSERAKEELTALQEQMEKQSDPNKKKDLFAEIKLIANGQTQLMQKTQTMLKKWEAGDPDTMDLWKKMNGWVYEGFDVTYKNLGIDFDKTYYESETWLLGKEIIENALKNEVLYKKPDGSIWIDLTKEGLDHKLLLRADGTSVYMTQDIGTAVLRHQELNCKQYIYVVGNEQDYHFKALAIILKKLGYDWADGIFHLSYGMVDLPEGKMKSREGTVVDADELMEDVIEEAKNLSQELGKTDEMPEEEKEGLYRILGLGALKYYILKVDPKKRMVFNPAESIDLRGNTGPFIQYAFARIQSLKKRAKTIIPEIFDPLLIPDEPSHRQIIRTLSLYEETIMLAAQNLSPALIANYVFELAREYNQFYQEFPVLKEENQNIASFRLAIADKTATTLKKCMFLLGIEMPERM